MKVLIVGVGKLGYKLAQLMIDEGIDVTLIDNNGKVLEGINEHIDVLTIEANGIDINVLKEIDIKTYDLLVASTDSDETNTVVCLLSKKLGCKKTIARIRNPEYLMQLDFIKQEMGIDHIVNPDLDIARSIEKYLLKNYLFHSDEFASGKVQMLDFHIGSHQDFAGKKLKDLEGFETLLITAILRDGEIIIPYGDTILAENDTIYIIGETKDINDFNLKFGFNKVYKEIKKVMILGGSNTAYYLAKGLAKANIGVKIIEKRRLKAEALSRALEDALIIHGDGTDINLLEEEMLRNMDAFVGVTGMDEQNLLMALMCKQAGVTKTIAKVSRQNYTKIIDRLEIDAALNPVYITASNILKFIRGGKVVSVSLLLGGEAEVTEIIVSRDSPFIEKPLIDLNLPKGVVIGAIIRRGEVIIPKGNATILSDDRIVIFSLKEDLETLKRFFNPRKGGLMSELWNRAKSTGNTFNN
ncbi:MAG: Trk system potassium transporter TrkA [Tissierella sp.]|uniref:Trk system potassium transporter TrkA n=1 Tax=Tissierella sp. TaxID=41274 RepID=UPI003F94C5AF